MERIWSLWTSRLKAGSAGALLVDWCFDSEMLWKVGGGWEVRRGRNEMTEERSC